MRDRNGNVCFCGAREGAQSAPSLALTEVSQLFVILSKAKYLIKISYIIDKHQIIPAKNILSIRIQFIRCKGVSRFLNTN
jgi:hypothetical protein